MEARRLARERADAERRAREEEEERQVPSPSPPPRAPFPTPSLIFTSLPHRAPSLSLQRELAARALMDAERQLAEAEYRRRVREQEELERTRKAREERDKAEAGGTRAEEKSLVFARSFDSLILPSLAVPRRWCGVSERRKKEDAERQRRADDAARKEKEDEEARKNAFRAVRSPVVPGSVVCLCFTRWHWLAPTTQPVGWCPCACVVPDLFACLPACLWVVIGALDGRVQIQVGGPEPVRQLPVQTQSHARCGYSPLSRPLSGAPISPTI